MLDPRTVGYVFLQLGRRCLYLRPPDDLTLVLSRLASAEVLIVTTSFPNGIRYRPRDVRPTDRGQATCVLVPADRMQERMEQRWLGPERDVTITRVILRTAHGEATLERGERGLYRVAA